MAGTTGTEWYESQRKRDSDAIASSESALGPEASVFADAMSVIARCLDAVFASDSIDNLVVKRKISVAHYAFNLLWSAWNEALAGRYQTATDHFRSIDEAPDFLTALHVDPALANELGAAQRSVKVERARRAVKDALRRVNQSKAGEWEATRLKQAKRVEPLSHVSVEALGQYLPVVTKDGQTLAVVRPGGMASNTTGRVVAIQLALHALQLLLSVTNAFIDVAGVRHSGWVGLAEKSGRLAEVLGKELAGIGSPESVDAVYFALTDEVIG